MIYCQDAAVKNADKSNSSDFSRKTLTGSIPDGLAPHEQTLEGCVVVAKFK